MRSEKEGLNEKPSPSVKGSREKIKTWITKAFPTWESLFVEGKISVVVREQSGGYVFLFVHPNLDRTGQRFQDVALGNCIDGAIIAWAKRSGMKLKLYAQTKHGRVCVEKQKLRVRFDPIHVVLEMMGKFGREKLKQYFLDSIARHGGTPVSMARRKIPCNPDRN